MKKNELIEQLNTAKVLSSTVDIDKVIELIKQIETSSITAEMGSEIIDRIERCLDRHSDDLANLDSAEFELNYDNRVELIRVEVNVYEIIEHVTEIVDSYVVLEEEEDEENNENEMDRGQESIILADVNKGLGLESGGNPYAEF